MDGIAEEMTMDAICDFSGKKKIVMVEHPMATVSQCDGIYLLAHGKGVDHGTYAK